MNLIGLRRLLAGFGAPLSVGGVMQRNPINGRRDKSACPKRCKPLTRLAFWRACRSVAGMKPGFSEGFQGFRMHGPEEPLSGASS
jgi:hypothetical protein